MRPPSRRRVVALLVSTALSTCQSGATRAAPGDQGIGGTGAAPPTGESDRGIGGTGVIGTIRKFGSIVVNELRIAYPSDAEVRIDGQPASVAALKIGQVVRVAALGEAGALSTRAIAVTSEVVGPIETIGPRRMTVLGQSVSLGAVKTKGLRRGDVVAVSGLRRNDGTIVASLIERRDGAPSRVTGPVDVAADGSLRIGGLKLSGIDPALIGRRAIVEGRLEGRTFVVTHATSESALLPSGITTLSVESYVERRGETLALGSGFAVEGIGPLEVPAGQSIRAVLTTSIGADGSLRLESLRSGGATYGGRGGTGGAGPGGMGPGGAGPGGAGPGGGAPGGRSPMNFGPSGRGPGGGVGGPPGGGSGAPGGAGGPPGGFGGPPGGYGGPPGGFGGGRR